MAQHDGVRTAAICALDPKPQVRPTGRVVRLEALQSPKLAEEGFERGREAFERCAVVGGRFDRDETTEQVDHLLPPRLQFWPQRGGQLGAAHAWTAARSVSKTSSRMLRALIRSRFGSKPRPGRSHGTSIAPAWARMGG